MRKCNILLALILSTLSLGCQNYGDPFKLPQKSDRDLIENFGLITNGMSKQVLLRTLGRPADAEGDFMHWIVYNPGRSLCVTFKGSVVTNVERRSWVDPPPLPGQ